MADLARTARSDQSPFYSLNQRAPYRAQARFGVAGLGLKPDGLA
jgi:hypothetical protein